MEAIEHYNWSGWYRSDTSGGLLSSGPRAIARMCQPIDVSVALRFRPRPTGGFEVEPYRASMDSVRRVGDEFIIARFGVVHHIFVALVYQASHGVGFSTTRVPAPPALPSGARDNDPS